MKALQIFDKKVQYALNKDGRFTIENYNHSKPFSNFFPGIADVWGIPMWVFYVNRGQCISSFGIEGKDKAIVEFQPANKAYRLTSLQGFRTFIKATAGSKSVFWEPFQNNVHFSKFKTQQKMHITAHDLTIEDFNATLGLVVRVNYFTMPDESFPALVRRVTIENVSKKNYSLEVIDGLPSIMPYGIKDWLIKNLSRTVEAWIKVRNLKNKAPFFHLNVEVSDTPDVKHIEEGNFYFSFDPDKKKPELLDAIVETVAVFGNASDLVSPQRFLEQKNFRFPKNQQTSNRTPCAMSFAKYNLPAGKAKEIVSLVGHVHSEAALKKVVKRVMAKGFIEKKARQNKNVVGYVQQYAFTNSSSPALNQYCTQTFLDNVLRGGLPVSLNTEGGKVAFNVFSRKHGDMERDYNYFVLPPTPLSQGNGNYRDVNQNRRNDVWFSRDVRDESIIDFLSLVQADGYNPLVVKGMSFYMEDQSKIDAILHKFVSGDSDVLRERLRAGFQPGELLTLVSHNGISLKASLPEFLGHVLGVCRKQTKAEHGEGFWVDHWAYNLDLVESFLSIYPEELKFLLTDKKSFSFYHNFYHVVPKADRYLLTERGVRQYHSVKDGHKEINPNEMDHRLRTNHGEGSIYYTNLFVKLLCLIANKAATLDPSGIGIEMEANKPSWYDALNGLPGLLGSSICETFELKRYCLFLLGAIEKLEIEEEQVLTFKELASFIRELKELLSVEEDGVSYWHKSNDIKERYRANILNGIDGGEEALSVSEIKDFLGQIVARVERGVERAKDKQGLIPTYFYHEVTDYALLGKRHGDHSHVLPVSFRKHTLPIFLEGFVHQMRVEKDQTKVKELYQKLKKSPLYDKKLKMYKVNTDLSATSEEIGRTRIFPRGWLENESIWLHMEYKYLLELLKAGLYKEFYETFGDVLIPFLKPEQYGRSTIENSSFLVSSAHEDAALHGQGFVARLSGSTAEFVHMWLLMNVGNNPFIWKREGLCLELKPALPGWLFTKQQTTFQYLDKEKGWTALALPKNTYAFNFLGSILTVYHNQKRCDTFDSKKCRIGEIILTYSHKQNPIKISGAVIPSPYAKDIRDGKIIRMDVYFE